MSEVKTVGNLVVLTTTSRMIFPLPVHRASIGNVIHQANTQGEDMSRIKWAIRCITLFALVLLTGCSPSQASEGESTAVSIGGYNHVAGQNVNWFSVNGYRTTLTGNSCCVMLPDQWRPGLTAHIEWEVDPNPLAHLPPLGTDAYNKAYLQHKSKYRRYSADVSIPQYNHLGGFSAHFLPCQQVKVYSGTEGLNSPAYPIKEPFKMEEPASCQK